MKPIAAVYSVKIWLSSALLGPLIVIFLPIVNSEPGDGSGIMDRLGFYLIIVFFELLFSLITWLVFWAFIEFIVRVIAGQRPAKVLITITGITFTALTFALTIGLDIDNFTFTDLFGVLSLANAILISLGIWFFKFPANNKSSLPVNLTTYEQIIE